MRVAVLTGLLTLLSLAAQADPVTVHAEGTGVTRDQAISNALIAAVGEATGVTVSSQQMSSTEAMSVSKDGSTTTGLVQATQDMIARTTNGRILSYQVETVDKAQEGGLLASISAQVEVFHPKGIGNANRRRIAVAVFDATDGHAAAGRTLRDKLLENLTQTRRFAVVDRSNDQAYQSEMALIAGPDANPAERARAGQVLGADYVVTGHVAQRDARTVGRGAQTSSHVLDMTGEVVTHTTPSTLHTIPGALSADFEVIEIATRQIKFAAHLEVAGGDFERLSQQIALRITTSIYPPRLVDVGDPQAVIIDQGGSGISTGQRFRVMQEGRELFDPYSGESLGRKEVQVAILEVGEVAEKVSYGRIVSGRVGGDPAGLVLRALDTDPAAGAGASAVRPGLRHPAIRRAVAAPAAAAAPDTGFKLPFDH
jgi:curli biogenesis system outer membrane secretion channel CsgG